MKTSIQLKKFFLLLREDANNLKGNPERQKKMGEFEQTRYVSLAISLETKQESREAPSR